MTILLTGASGFIGGQVLDRLLKLEHEVRTLVFEPAEIEPLRARGVDVRFGDIGDDIDFESDLNGVERVIHCAGVAPARMGLVSARLNQVNIEGTKRLLQASARAQVSRFVFLSTSAVYGAAPPPIVEETPAHPVGAYAQSKWAGEELVRRFQKEHELPSVILRPSLVYGPGDAKFSAGLLRVSRMPILPLPAEGKRILDLVYVSDLVEAILAATWRPEAVSGTFNITDGEKHTVRELLDACAKVTGAHPKIVALPQGALTAIPTLVEQLNRNGRSSAVGGRLAGLAILDLDIHFSIDAAREQLAYAPRIGLEEGIQKALEYQMEQQSRNGHQARNGRGPSSRGDQTPLASAHLYDTKMQGALSQEYYGHSDFYNWGYWTSETRNQREASENLVDVLLDLIPNREGNILDVACGLGASTRQLLTRYSIEDVVGVNLSEAQLDRARENAPGVPFLAMNATSLGFPDESFDNVICVEAAFHFRPRDAFLKEAWRVLKPGGTLVMSDLLLARLPGRRRTYFPRENYVSNLDEYRQSFLRAGFAEARIIDATEACWKSFRRSLLHWGLDKVRQGEIAPLTYLAGVGYYSAAGLVVRTYPLTAAKKADNR